MLDEHAGSRRMMSFTIATRGHICVPVESAAEAHRALADFDADAIVYDWNQRSGALLGFGRDAKARHSSVRGVIVTSSLDEPADFRLNEAIDDYFTKPVAMREIVDRLELIVRSRRG
ncbi:MAG: hypothetical protein AB7T06_10860 [Kofleriaceae bacterium]